MIAVGIRELKSQLSAYVRLVRAGEVVQITDRGEVVAEMRLPTPVRLTDYPELDRLITAGAASLPTGRVPEGFFTSVVASGLSSERLRTLLDEERGQR